MAGLVMTDNTDNYKLVRFPSSETIIPRFSQHRNQWAQARSHAMIMRIRTALEFRLCSLTVVRRKRLGVLLREY